MTAILTVKEPHRDNEEDPDTLSYQEATLEVEVAGSSTEVVMSPNGEAVIVADVQGLT